MAGPPVKLSPYLIGLGIVVFVGAMTFSILRGESTRERVRVVERTVDPCDKPKSDACQRRIRLVLRELVRRHPKALRKPGDFLNLKLPETGDSGNFAGGGGAGTSPPGGGPIGRVPSPGSPPEKHPPNAPETPEPPPPERKPLIDLDAPVPLETCVGDLLGLNCR